MKSNRLIRCVVIVAIGGLFLATNAFSDTVECLPSSSDMKTVLTNGKKIYDATCGVCHNPSMAAAPTPAAHNEKDWDNMLTLACKGNDSKACSADALKKPDPLEASCVLLPIAIKGKNAMPAKGGDANLSNDKLQSAITFMMSKKDGD